MYLSHAQTSLAGNRTIIPYRLQKHLWEMLYRRERWGQTWFTSNTGQHGRDKLAMTGKASWLQVYLFVKAETVLHPHTVSSQHHYLSHHPPPPAYELHLSVKYRAIFEVNTSSEPLIHKPFINRNRLQLCEVNFVRSPIDKTEIMQKKTVQTGQVIPK